MEGLRNALDATSLTDQERRVLERLVVLLRSELADELRAVWLYGSRARGEPPATEDSDVDLIVITDGGRRRHGARVSRLVWRAAEEEGVSPVVFAVIVQDPAWVAQRRAVRSFFIQEVDRDKLALVGDR